MVDYAIQRANMIESQIRPNGVTDSRILAAMGDVPRELFVPEDKRPLAYMDEDLPLGRDSFHRPRWLFEPMSTGRLIQMADIGENDTVLDVSCGSGYSSAVLSRLAKRVIALEDDAGLAQRADTRLREIGCTNVEVVVGIPADGLRVKAPYDVILINGRVREVPEVLIEQLTLATGRLVAAIARGTIAPATVFTRARNSWSSRRGFDLFMPDAVGFPAAVRDFVF